MVSGPCLNIVRTMSGWCLDVVLTMSGTQNMYGEFLDFPEICQNVSGTCLDSVVWSMSTPCVDRILNLFGPCLDGVHVKTMDCVDLCLVSVGMCL